MNKFKVGVDSIDDWLNDLNETFLYFKVPIDAKQFNNLSNHTHHHVKENGQIFINGIWHTQKVEITIFMTENGLLNTNNVGDKFDNYKVNFLLNIIPKDFKIQKKPHHIKKTIVIGVTLGRINKLQPGMEKLLEEAYNH
jgi:hypothetical protein